MTVPQETLRRLADKFTPNFTQVRRMSTCAGCERRVVRPYHCWLMDGKYLKELHLCGRCWRRNAE
jgi:hypothetical protein